MGTEYNLLVDYWALGCMMFEMVAGTEKKQFFFIKKKKITIFLSGLRISALLRAVPPGDLLGHCSL